MNSEEQTKPLAQSPSPRKGLLKGIGFGIAGVILVAAIITVLALTVFRIKDPEIRMNKVTIPKFSLENITSTLNIVAELGVKNPNVAAYRYDNGTSYIYYHGSNVGKAYTPQGVAKARRTKDMNLSMEINTSQVLANPNFFKEFGMGKLTMSSYTRLDGRVRIVKIFKKHVVLEMNCSLTANITNQKILEQKCISKVSL